MPFTFSRPSFSDLNTLVTMALAMYVVGATGCRFVMIEMKKMQYRYVAPIVLAFLFGIFSFFSIVGGDTPDYFTGVGLLACTFSLMNSRRDWSGGQIPEHMLRRSFDLSTLDAEKITSRPVVQNFLAGGAIAVTVLVTGVAAMEGRGNPLQIYSMHADPRVVTSGASFDIVFSLRRTRICAGAIDRFIVNEETDQIVQRFAPSPVGGMSVGVKRDDIRVKLKLDNLPPAVYRYRSVITSYCDDQPAPYVQRTPDVQFIVTPAEVK